jgi:P-type Cu+ transporter
MVKKKTNASLCEDCKSEVPGTSNSQQSFPSSPLSTLNEKSLSSSVKHVEVASGGGDFIAVHTIPDENLFEVELSIVGMTCSACTGAITRAVKDLSYVREVNVSLLTNSAKVLFEGRQHAEDIKTTIEDAGFDASIESVESKITKPVKKDAARALWRAEYSIGGMTCSACSNSIIGALEHLPFIENININVISNSGVIVFEGEDNLARITTTIEDCGFDASVEKFERLGAVSETERQEREVFIQIDEMYCHHCPQRILNAIKDTYGNDVQILQEPTIERPILKISYMARAPDFTIRQILTTINSVHSKFVTSIYLPPTIEERAKELQAKERKTILFRLALAVSAAIPAFIIGVVCMTVLGKTTYTRQYMMTPIWSGHVSRADWALFILATPVYFVSAAGFHHKAIKELRALWRRGSQTPFIQRFTRFGSMNMLMSLGTTIAYFSSIAELAISASHSHMPVHHHDISHESNGAMETQMQQMMEGMDDEFAESHNYFDSVIFLTMFLLLGRFIEAYTKAKTGDAVTALGKLRPSEAILIEETDVAGRRLAIGLLEVGDVVLVPNGASPPFDGIVIDGSASFDESSLTGESRLVEKFVGDQVYSGTVNKTGPISVKLTSISGTSMLDQIIKVVREGQTRRAPVERAADLITSHFVPFVVLVGIITWSVWIGLGMGHALPEQWVDGHVGGWPLWALRFAIAVFVIACPCGIGLAAPTALFVGGGLAAKNGILVKGGGEAFQEASSLDCIVFDKTGTLTEGGQPSVVDYATLTDDNEEEVLAMVQRLEENSVHPIAKAMVKFCEEKTSKTFAAQEVEETPGKGLHGKFKVEDSKNGSRNVELLVGNEALMTQYQVVIDSGAISTLQQWKLAAHSVVLVAIRVTTASGDVQEPAWRLTTLFGIADGLRPEAQFVVKALQERGISVWMLSGDNAITAQAVGKMVGIAPENIIAGVLPDQKAEKIKHLQKTLPKPKRKSRAMVAMVGDGINDSPALTNADVGIAIGSGSDVAISSASFILISSDLQSIITLIDLSRVVFRRVLFNFGWALVYNIVAMPIAAGAFFAIHVDGKHLTLGPVWASLAMALSSISVVCSSLMLRSRLPFVGFKATHVDIKKDSS